MVFKCCALHLYNYNHVSVNISPATVSYYLRETEKDEFIWEMISLILVEVPLIKLYLTSNGAILFGQKTAT